MPRIDFRRRVVRFFFAMVLLLVASSVAWLFLRPEKRLPTPGPKTASALPLEVTFLVSDQPGVLREVALGPELRGKALFPKVRVKDHAYLSVITINTARHTNEMVTEALPIAPGLPEFIPFGEDVFTINAEKGEVLCLVLRTVAQDLMAFSETMPIESWREEGRCFDF